MPLNPALRSVVAAATAKYQMDAEPARGIIPFEPVEIDARDVMIARATEMISKAITGPAIRADELAERIVNEVLGIDAEWGE